MNTVTIDTVFSAPAKDVFPDRMIQGPATGKTRHPGLHYFNSLEWLQFAEMHMRHHFRQKKRIDACLTEPPSSR
ncbi:MAG TPA: hypothetical protein VGQ51_09945 [Puia sp.]|nr:hypothetical protein [Puia sp.]